MDQDPLFLVFLDLRKEHENLDCGRLLKTLEGYGAGPKMRDILAEFWEWQEVVTQKNVYNVSQFRVTRGTTQGGMKLLTLFNVVVEKMVRNWLSMTVEDDTIIHDDLGHAVGQIMGVFYAYNGFIGSQDPEWLQRALNVIIGLSL